MWFNLILISFFTAGHKKPPPLPVAAPKKTTSKVAPPPPPPKAQNKKLSLSNKEIESLIGKFEPLFHLIRFGGIIHR